MLKEKFDSFLALTSLVSTRTSVSHQSDQTNVHCSRTLAKLKFTSQVTRVVVVHYFHYSFLGSSIAILIIRATNSHSVFQFILLYILSSYSILFLLLLSLYEFRLHCSVEFFFQFTKFSIY